MKVAVVILNWNGKSLLQEYLPAVLEFTPHNPKGEVEVVVADNGSSDGSLEFLRNEFSSVRLIELGANYGFAEGYNLALQQVDSEYSILLNSDVKVTKGWLEELIGYMDAHPDVAACQPKLLSIRNQAYFEHAGASGGFIDSLGYPFCRGRVFEAVEKDFGQYDTLVDIFWATGACLCIRTDLYKRAGGLDKRFFAHMEEIDLCWRLRSQGHRIQCVPKSVVYHLGGATLKRENPHKTFLNYRNNLLMLYKNAPQKDLCRILFLRFFFDQASFVVFLLSGKFGDAWAVWRARFAFWQMLPSYRSIRKENLRKQVLPVIPEVLKGSILISYFLKGQNKFSDLKSF